MYVSPHHSAAFLSIFYKLIDMSTVSNDSIACFALRQLCCVQGYVFPPQYARLAIENEVKLLEQNIYSGCNHIVLDVVTDWEQPSILHLKDTPHPGHLPLTISHRC